VDLQTDTNVSKAHKVSIYSPEPRKTRGLGKWSHGGSDTPNTSVTQVKKTRN